MHKYDLKDILSNNSFTGRVVARYSIKGKPQYILADIDGVKPHRPVSENSVRRINVGTL